MACVASVAVLGSCGGGNSTSSTSANALPSGAPKPTETIDQFATRLGAAYDAIAAGDCAKVDAFNKTTPSGPAPQPDLVTFKLSCSPKGDPTAKGFKVTNGASFGTAGVVDYTTNGASSGNTAVVALNLDGKYAMLVNADLSKPPAPGVKKTPAQQVGTMVTDQPVRQKTVDEFIQAVRNKDCNTYFMVGFTLSQDKAMECAIEFNPKAVIQPDLANNPQAKPVSFGGTAAFGFFGLVTNNPTHYRTLFLAPGTAGVPYVVQSFRAG